MSHIPNHARSKKIASWAGILCIACCAVPIIGIVMGSAALAGLAVYTERAVLVILIGVTALLAYQFFARKKPGSCGMDCSCRPESTRANQPKKDEAP